MSEIRYMLLLIKEHFRRNDKTSWGKNELIKELDKLEDKLTGDERKTQKNKSGN